MLEFSRMYTARGQLVITAFPCCETQMFKTAISTIGWVVDSRPGNGQFYLLPHHRHHFVFSFAYPVSIACPKVFYLVLATVSHSSPFHLYVFLQLQHSQTLALTSLLRRDYSICIYLVSK